MKLKLNIWREMYYEKLTMLKEGETKMEEDEKEQFRVQGKRWRTNIKYAYLNSNLRIEKHSSKLSVYAKKRSSSNRVLLLLLFSLYKTLLLSATPDGNTL